jgi:hypothetical protein
VLVDGDAFHEDIWRGGQLVLAPGRKKGRRDEQERAADEATGAVEHGDL